MSPSKHVSATYILRPNWQQLHACNMSQYLFTHSLCYSTHRSHKRPAGAPLYETCRLQHSKQCLQEEIERGFLRRAMTLCQDTDYIVRINMCDGLHRLAAAVGLEVTVSTILPEILELMKDEEALVRVSATNSLVAGSLAALHKAYIGLLASPGNVCSCRAKRKLTPH